MIKSDSSMIAKPELYCFNLLLPREAHGCYFSGDCSSTKLGAKLMSTVSSVINRGYINQKFLFKVRWLSTSRTFGLIIHQHLEVIRRLFNAKALS